MTDQYYEDSSIGTTTIGTDGWTYTTDTTYPITGGTIINSVEPIDEQFPHVCYECGRYLNFREVQQANPTKTMKFLKDLWENPEIQLLCCNCHNNKSFGTATRSWTSYDSVTTGTITCVSGDVIWTDGNNSNVYNDHIHEFNEQGRCIICNFEGVHTLGNGLTQFAIREDVPRCSTCGDPMAGNAGDGRCYNCQQTDAYPIYFDSEHISKFKKIIKKIKRLKLWNKN